MGETLDAVVAASLMTVVVVFPSEVSAPSFVTSVGVNGVVVPSLSEEAAIGVDAFLKSSEEMVSKGTHSPVDPRIERELIADLLIIQIRSHLLS